jgi:beta-lactamase regulating signal transducer with metallopeptidase domain
MYFLRGLFVSLSVFVLLYVLGSVVVGCVWRQVQCRTQRLAPASAANVLYALRSSPLGVALLIVLGFTVPSFLRFEPSATGEALGVLPIVLTMVFAALAAVSASRAWNAYSRTRRSIRRWTSGAARLESGHDVEFFQAANDAPPVALAGISKPALVISAAAAAALTPRELSRAVAHEIAHLRARDNLKKLLLHACTFPRMSSLEHAWLAAVEYSADSAAVHTQPEALDLASALVKISRLSGCGSLPELASGLVEGPNSLLEARVQRLIQWSSNAGDAPSPRVRFGLAALLAISGLMLIVTYPSLLKTAHLFTELLVR